MSLDVKELKDLVPRTTFLVTRTVFIGTRKPGKDGNATLRVASKAKKYGLD
jgi:hypothetical protein